MHELVNYSTI